MNHLIRQLYDNTIQNDYHFAYGGIVDEKVYATQEKKLLFLLKEVIDESRAETWSLVDFINKQISSNSFLTIWKRVGELSYGLHNRFPPYHSDVTNSFHDRHIAEGLRSIAMTNLKKTGGSNQSDIQEIREHAKRNKELLQSELRIMKPDLVVCGGTFNIVCEVFEIDASISNSGARTAKWGDMVFIEFVHPGYYMLSPKIMYAYFKEVINQL